MKERIALWDNLRAVLILTVVLAHFSETIINNGVSIQYAKSIYIFIEALCMPTFIFVSGLFHRNKNIPQKVFSFTAISIFYKIVIFVICRLTTGKATFHLFKEGGSPWFMFALAVFVLVTYLLRDVDPRLVLVTAIALGCFAGYDKTLGDFLCLSRIIVLFPCYFVGTMVNRVKLEELSKKKALKILGLAILIAWAVLCVVALDKVYLLRPLMTCKNAYCKVNLPHTILFRALCYCISGLLGFAWILVVPTKRIFAVTTIGQRTMQIYFWHRPLIYVIVNLGLASTMIGNTIGQVIWMLLGVVMTVILAWKPLRYPTDLFLNFRSATPANKQEPISK